MSDAIIGKTYAVFDNAANRKLIADLENSGAGILQFPPIESEPILRDESLIEILENLARFDWLIFPDVLAVDYFLEILEANAIDFYELDQIRVCAFGETVADRLRFASLHADVIPATIKTESVFAAMINYVGERELNGLKILFPKEVLTADFSIAKLKDKGAAISELPVYRIEIKNKLEITKLKILLKSGAADEFVFTSPTDLIALEYYFRGENVADIFSETKALAIDGVMLQALIEREIETVGLFHPGKLAKVER